MPSERPASTDDAKFRAALARHLEIDPPTEVEQAHGFTSSATIILAVHDRGDHWLVVTHRAQKLRAQKAALPKFAG